MLNLDFITWILDNLTLLGNETPSILNPYLLEGVIITSKKKCLINYELFTKLYWGT